MSPPGRPSAPPWGGLGNEMKRKKRKKMSAGRCLVAATAEEFPLEGFQHRSTEIWAAPVKVHFDGCSGSARRERMGWRPLQGPDGRGRSLRSGGSPGNGAGGGGVDGIRR